MAIILSLVTTCKNLGIDVGCYLGDVLSRVDTHPHQRLDELLPDRWKGIQEAAGVMLVRRNARNGGSRPHSRLELPGTYVFTERLHLPD